MNILLGFAPYIAFFVVLHAGSAVLGLWAAFIVALAIAARVWLRTRSTKVLEIGNVVLFAALALFTTVAHWEWTLMALRLTVDAGLLVIVLVSLAIGRLFTLQYARERVPRQYWDTPQFLAINRTISWVWAAAFAVIVACHATAVVMPAMPLPIDVAITVLALVAAYRFTTWYPERVRGLASRSL
jgi:hypothetical protein